MMSHLKASDLWFSVIFADERMFDSDPQTKHVYEMGHFIFCSGGHFPKIPWASLGIMNDDVDVEVKCHSNMAVAFVENVSPNMT